MGHFAEFRQVKIIDNFAEFGNVKNFDKTSLVKTVCLDKYISGHKYIILFKTTNQVTGYSVYNFLYSIYISVLTTIDLSQNDVTNISDLL